MEELKLKIISPQQKYYEKNKEKIKNYCREFNNERYNNNFEYRKYLKEKYKESYLINKIEYDKKSVERQIKKYKDDPEYRQRKLDYAKKYRELKKIEKESI